MGPDSACVDATTAADVTELVEDLSWIDDVLLFPLLLLLLEEQGDEQFLEEEPDEFLNSRAPSGKRVEETKMSTTSDLIVCACVYYCFTSWKGKKEMDLPSSWKTSDFALLTNFVETFRVYFSFPASFLLTGVKLWLPGSWAPWCIRRTFYILGGWKKFVLLKQHSFYFFDLFSNKCLQMDFLLEEREGIPFFFKTCLELRALVFFIFLLPLLGTRRRGSRMRGRGEKCPSSSQ